MPVDLSGPGILATRRIAPKGLRAGFWDEMAANGELYPLGVDLLLVAGPEIMGLPRSTTIAFSSESESGLHEENGLNQKDSSSNEGRS